MKPPLTILWVLCFVTALPVSAQITIDDLPFPVGSGLYAQYNTDNEDGANTPAIDALIAQSGENQTYDLTPIAFEDLFTGTYTVAIGPTGPGAGTEPLDQATKTLILPFAGEDEGNVFEGTIYDYVRETDDAAYNMGGYFEGELNGSPASFLTIREPGGDQEFAFPMTSGTTWTTEFTEATTFGGSTFEVELEKEYEVDGWGTMLIPGVEGPIDVLRVKVTTGRIVTGLPFPLTSVCYDLRANGPYAATFCEGGSSSPPTANVTVLDVGGTDAESVPATPALNITSVYPNPARSAITLEYVVPQNGAVELRVYDVLGRPVRRVVEGTRSAGTHTETLDVQGLAPGVYVARLTVDRQYWTQRLTITR